MKPLMPAPEARLSLGIVSFLAAACVVALGLSSPPKPLPATAPPTEFSAERAFRHVQAIAKVPRPAGTAANAEARAYVLRELQALGIQAEIVTTRLLEGHRAAEVHNVLARLPGQANTKAFALMGHHDSVRYGPGAADDGSAVAALLETARALRVGPPLSNDVLLVFTDGEESGLLGAKTFARHPWAAQTGVMLGLESRGTSGGSLMFETSRSNGWLIAELARARVGAFASSLSSSIYESMPFNGDFSWLKNHGQHGFHAAFISDFAWYHTGNDQPEHLSLASLQHQGNYALGLSRHFGNLPLHEVTAPDAVYFNTFGPRLVHYPKTWSAPLAIATGVLALFVLLLGLRRKRVSPLGMLAGIATFAGSAVAVVLVTLVFLALIFGPANLSSIYHSRMSYLPELRPLYHNDLYGLAFALGAVGLFSALLNLFRGRIGTMNLASGALVWWGILLALLQTWLPGGSYLATWPTVFAALQLLILFAISGEKSASVVTVAWVTPLTLPAIFLLVPGYRYLLSSVMIISAPVLVMILVLLGGVLIPQLEVITRVRRWMLPALAAAAALTLLITGHAANGVTAKQPDFNCLAYGLDRDSSRAFWMSSDAATDEWTSQFFPPGTPCADVTDFFPRFSRPCLRASAPMANLAGAEVRVASDSIQDGRRHLSLQLASPDHAPTLKVQVTSDTEILRATVFGEPVSESRRAWEFTFTIFPRDGAVLELELPPDVPLKLKLVEQYFGLPVFPKIRPRPEYLLCEPNTLKHNRSIGSDQILVTRSFTLKPPGQAVAGTSRSDTERHVISEPATTSTQPTQSLGPGETPR
jgi:hypothetical protein